MKKNFAIVGCGHIANRHVKHIQAHKLGEVVGVFDIDKNKMIAFCKQYNVIGFKSFSELLNSEDVDVVNICTPNGTHAELAIKSLLAGKNTLVEKPMSISVESAKEMQSAAKKSGMELFIVKQNRYNPPVKAVKSLIKEGKLSRPFLVSVNCFWNRNEAYYQQSDWRGTKELDGGTLFTQFSHFIDILYYLFGEIEDVSGVMDNMTHNGLIEFEDSGTFTFKFSNGGMGNLNFTTSAFHQNMEGAITIFSDNATVKIGGKYLNTIDYQVTDGFDILDIPISSSANNYGFYEGSMSNHDKVIDNVIETLNGRQKIMTNSEEGVKVIEMISQFYESVK
jgi:predicted dehydrogenase